MSYRQDVEASHRTTYANNIQMVAQENPNKLRAAVTVVGGLTGDAHNVRDLLGKEEYSESEDYSHQNPNNRSKLDAVWLKRPLVVETGEVIYKEDKFDLAMDPTSQFNRNKVLAVERGVFDRFLGIRKKENGTFEIAGGGILGERMTGKLHSTKNSLPAGQYLAVGGTGMTLDKLIEARERLGLADFGLDDDINSSMFSLIGPKQITNLLQIAKQTGASLNAFDIMQLQMGKPTTLMGVTWIYTNRLPLDANGDRICPIWTKENIIGGFWQEVEGDMWNLTEAKNRPYIYVSAYPTATRLEDEGVIAIPCNEP